MIWGAFGIGEVLALTYLFGPIINNIPYGPNDKPIGGSVLPVLGFNIAALLAVVFLSLYSLGYWSVDFSARKTKVEIGTLAILLASLILLWASPVFLFSLVVALIILLAVIID